MDAKIKILKSKVQTVDQILKNYALWNSLPGSDSDSERLIESQSLKNFCAIVGRAAMQHDRRTLGGPESKTCAKFQEAQSRVQIWKRVGRAAWSPIFGRQDVYEKVQSRVQICKINGFGRKKFWRKTLFFGENFSKSWHVNSLICLQWISLIFC